MVCSESPGGMGGMVGTGSPARGEGHEQFCRVRNVCRGGDRVDRVGVGAGVAEHHGVLSADAENEREERLVTSD